MLIAYLLISSSAPASSPNFLVYYGRDRTGGFCVLSRTASLIDAFLFEDFGTFYNFTFGRYEKLSGEELVELRATYGFAILALAYADPSDEDVMEDYMSYVNSLAAEYGFIPYVADINLAYAQPEEAGVGV